MDQIRKATADDKELSDADRKSSNQSLASAQQSLDRSDAILLRAKQSNVYNLRQAGRQVQLNRSHAPNIILVTVEDLGYGELGSYGQPLMATPHLDQMALEGNRSLHYYTGSPVDLASQATLFTGQHTGHGYIRGDAPRVLRSRDCTLTEMLWQAGYDTAGIGGWKLGGAGTTGQPNRQGFDYWYGYLDRQEATDLFPDFLWRNGQQVTVPANADKKTSAYAADLFVADTIAYLEQHHANLVQHRGNLEPYRSRRPFFLHLAYPLPNAIMPLPTEPYADRPWTAAQKNRAALVTRMDLDMGLLLEALKRLCLDERTLVIFTSDNGPRLLPGEPPSFFSSTGGLRGHYGTLYEGGLCVPMIVRWPHHVPAGTINRQVWTNWDLLPTLADLVRAWVRPAPLDGISVKMSWLGAAPVERPALYWELPQAGLAQAVLSGKWKGVRTAVGRPLELYDLNVDPGETQNVTAEHPDVVANLEDLLRLTRTPPEA